MVAIVTGTGLGLERGSGWVLGSRGQLGSATFGRYGEAVTVNAATGNLIINRTDEILIGQGPDSVISRAYNSLGSANDDNGDNWRLNAQRQVVGLTGTVGTAGSTVTRIDWDGSDTLYTYDATRGAYVCMQGSGAYDTLTFASGVWTWTDGDSRQVETYDDTNGGRITASRDTAGNQLTFTYLGNQLKQIATQDGEHTDLTWSGNNISLITTTSAGGATLTRTRYTYDANRLSTVTTDLSPTDNSVSDGNTVTTTYTYDGANRVASISQSDGAYLAIGYDGSGRVHTVAQTMSSGVINTTTFTYGTFSTTVTDTFNQSTTLTYDANGQLVRMDLPPAQAGAAAQSLFYSYNGRGDVMTATDGSGNVTAYEYDNNGNLILSQDQLGEAVSYTYDTNNQLLTETHYTAPATGTNTAPTAGAYSLLVTSVGDTATFDPRIVSSDPNGDSLYIAAVSSPSHGTATIVNGTQISYTRTGAGSDSFTYTISDGHGHTSTATVTVTDVSGGTNTAPTATTDSIIVSGVGDTLTFDPRANDSDPEGDRLTVTSVSAASHGTVTIVNGGAQISYARTSAGTDSFTYTVSDGHGHTATATVSVGVSTGGTNVAPAAANDSITVVSVGDSLSFDPRANDSDADGDVLTITAVSAASHGTATITGGGSRISYARTSAGADSFTYTISDGNGHTATATVSVTDVISATNTAPTAAGDAIVVGGIGDALTFDPRANDSDPEGDVLTVTAVSAATHGTASIVNGGKSIAYTRSSAGADSFTYTISDGHGHTATATVTVTDTAGGSNTAPTGGNDSITVVSVGDSLSFDPRANDSDPDGDVLTITAVGTPSHGTATITGSGTRISYVRTSAGADSFTYTISDGHGHTTTATVSVTDVISGTNTAPTAAADSIVVAAVNDVLTFDPRANDSDPEHDALTITAVSAATHGTATIASGGQAIVYTRSSAGADSFTYTISDGHGHTSTATVTVAAVYGGAGNSAPTAVAQAITVVAVGDTLSFDPRAGDSDPDGDVLTITAVGTPSHGTATITGGGTRISYTRSSLGADSFTYTISDGNGHTATATVTVGSATGATNTAPTAVTNGIGSLSVGSTLVFDPRVNDSDPDGDALTITAIGTPAHGTATIVSGGKAISYTRTSAGAESFTYTISDGNGHTATATITDDVGEAPIAANDGISIGVGNSVTFDPRANDSDPDGDKLTITAVSSPTAGTATIVNGGKAITYSRTAAGNDSFTYTISDGNGHTATATVSVTDNGQPNLPPVMADDSLSVAVGDTKQFNPLVNDYDPDGNALSIEQITTPTHGTAMFVGDGGTNFISYHRTSAGTDTLQYQVTDGHGHTAWATVTIGDGTTSANVAPVAHADTLLAPTVGQSYGFLPTYNDGDFDNDTLTVTAVSTAAHGTVTFDSVDNGVYYARTSAGSDSFTYTVSDGHGHTATATVTVIETDVVPNAAPVLVDDQLLVANIGDSVSFDPLRNDTDFDADTLTITSISTPSHGTLSTDEDGSPVYTRTSAGIDTFTYTVSDGHGHSKTATITVNQTAAFNYAPKTVNDTIIVTTVGGTTTFDPRVNDTDYNGDTLTITAVGSAAHGTVSIGGSGTNITYTRTSAGADSFTYTISDGNGHTTTGTVTVAATTGVTNHAPSLAADKIIITTIGGTVTFDPRVNDTDFEGDALTITAVGVAAHGTPYIGGGGTNITYTRSTAGADSFTYTVTDALGQTSTATITVAAVTGVPNVAPVAVNDTVYLVAVGASTTIDPRVNDADFDLDTLTITAVSTPTHGTATIGGSGTNITYTRTGAGADSFTYTISDGQGHTATATVTIAATTGVANTAPTAVNDKVIVASVGSTATFDPRINDTDFEGDTLTITAVSTPTHGTATIGGSGTNITYTRSSAGADSFTYTISDGNGHTTTATVTVAATNGVANVAPVALSDTVYLVAVGASTTIDPRVNDADFDNDTLTITAVSTPTHGTATIGGSGTNIVYTRTGAGADSFTYTISDGQGHTATATVTIAATTGVANTAPTAVNDKAIVASVGSSATFDPRINDTDFEGDTLTITAVGSAAHGTVSIGGSGTNVTYTRTSAGADSFTYTTSDGNGHTATATVSVADTTGVGNVAPVAVNDALVVNAIGDAVKFDPRANDADFDVDTLTITAVSTPAHGVVSIAGGGTAIVYTRTSAGADSITYTISDGHGHTATATVSITGSGTVPAWGATTASQPVTTRFAYDSASRLRFAVSALGEVTEYRYNSVGQQTSSITYRDVTYNVGSLGTTDTISESALSSWAAGLSDKSTVARVDTAYDFRGNISTVTSFSQANADGTGQTSAPYTVVTYVYDQYGNLLSRQTSGISTAETFIYDGLGRITGSTAVNGTTSSYVFSNSANSTVMTLSNGLVETSTYNAAGELISYAQSGSGGLATTTSYSAYDALGRLRMVTDANGNKSYFLYDTVGRKVADIAADGAITEYRYDASDRLVSTTAYANKVSSLSSLVDSYGNPTNVALSTIRPTANAGDVWSWRVYDTANRVIESIDNNGDATVFAYDGRSNLVSTTSYANPIASGTVTGFRTTAPTTLQLPTADSSHDTVTRNFFDSDGRLIGALDGAGYLSQIIYNAAGQKTETVSYAGITSSSLRASGSFTNLLNSITTGASDIHTRYFYDGRGALKYMLDNALTVTEYGYDSAGNLLHTFVYGAPIGTASTYTAAYIAGQITTLGLASNTDTRRSWNVYDSFGRVLYQIDAEGRVTKTAYTELDKVRRTFQWGTIRTTTTDPSQTDMNTWNTAAPQVADRRITEYSYDVSGKLLYTIRRIADENSVYYTEYRYDAAGHMTSQIQYADAYAYAGVVPSAIAAQIGSTLPSTAVQTSFTYDVDGRITDSFDGLGVCTHTVYDALGRVTDTTVAYGTADASTTHIVYDAAGRVSSQTAAYGAPEAATTSFTYDGLGHVLTRTDARGNTSTYTYNTLGQLLSSSVPIDASNYAVTTFQYDAFGNAIVLNDSRGNNTYNFYDSLDRLTLTIDAEGYATRTNYNLFGEVTSVVHYVAKVTATITPGVAPTVPTTPGADETTTFVRDKTGQVTKTTDAEGYYEQYTLNGYGQRLSMRNKLGGTTYYTYDKLGQLISEVLPISSVRADGTTEASSVTNTYAYDARGNRTQMVEASGLADHRTTNIVYDKLNRVISTTTDQVSVTASDLKTTSLVTPTTHTIYDNRGDVIEQDDAAGARTLFYYNKLGRRIAQIDALGTLSTWTYTNGNITSQRVYETQLTTLPPTPGGTPPSGTGNYRETLYTYDKANELLTTRVVGVRVGELGSSYTTSTSDIVITNTYDKGGNIIAQTDGRGNTVWYWYDKNDRKVAEVDQELYLTTYALNADGNVVTETRFANKLGTAPSTPPSTTVPSTTPDTTNDRVTNFTYDRNGRRLTEQRTGVVAWTVNASTGALSAAATTAIVAYTYNGLGEVSTKTEASGDVTTYSYDYLGRQTAVTGQAFTDYSGASVTAVTNQSYDGLNNLTRTVQNTSHVTTFTYGVGGRLTSMTDAAGFVHNYEYDVDGRQVKDSYTRYLSDGTTAVTEASATRYDLLGRAVFTAIATYDGTNWNFGENTQIQYNAFGEVTARGVSSTSTAGTQETFSYDKAGHVWKSTAEDGTVKLYIDDANGNQTLTITSDGNALPSSYSWSTITLDQAIALLTAGGGAIGSVAVPGMQLSVATYDKRGLQTQMKLAYTASGAFTHSKSYNAFGEVASQTDALGNTANFTYNTIGKVIQQQNPNVAYTDETGLTSYARPTLNNFYDLSGRVVGTEDANGNINTRLLLTGTGYGDTDPLVLKEFHADSGVLAHGYDVFGDLRSTTSEMGSVETFAYDAMDRLIIDTHPTRAAYTAGNPTGAAQTLIDSYTYDGLGRRITHSNNFLGSSVKETTDYDSQGRVSRNVDFDGYATTYSYVWSASIVTTGMGVFGGWTKTTSQYDLTGSSPIRSETEDDDYFGRTVDKTDFGGHSQTINFDLAGRVSWMANINAVNSYDITAYTYNALGEVASIANGYEISNTFGYITGSADFSDQYSNNAADKTTTTYGYDANGNRTSESTVKEKWTSEHHYNGDEWLYIKHGYDTTSLENATATYDSNGRLATETDSGYAGTAPISITWKYDLNSNIRETSTTYRALGATGTVASTDSYQDNWYKYDAMNRFVTTKGSFFGTAGSGYIYGGTVLTYNYDGTRATMNDGTSSEAYTYTADGLIAKVTIGGVQRATYAYDAMGRVLDYKEYDSGGSTAVFSHDQTYDAKSQVLSDVVFSNTGSSSTTKTSTYDYTAAVSYNVTTHMFTYGGAYQGGAVTHIATTTVVTGSGAGTTHQDTQNTYFWYDGTLQTGQVYYGDTTHPTTYNTSTWEYDDSNALDSVIVADGHPRTVQFYSNAQGEILKRDENASGSSNTPHEMRYTFNGQIVGYTSNNGTSDTDYAADITQHTTATGSGYYRNGSTSASPYANFDQSYDPLNGDAVDSASSSYTIAQGDTLQSIAQAVWGDSSLWYLIADANGLTAGSTLVAGATISIPNRVVNIHNNANTFKVYDPNQAIGDVAPTVPKAKHNSNCGVFGQILLTVIAIVVAFYTAGATLSLLGVQGATTGAIIASATLPEAIVAGAVGGAAGSIVSQGVGLATGIQSKFDWGAVGLAAIGGAVSGGLGPNLSTGLNGAFGSFGPIGGAIARGVASNILTQGIGVATGLQKKFDWAGVAAAGVGAGISSAVGGWIGVGADGNSAFQNDLLSGVAGIAGSIADAATRTLINGTDFGDNLVAALPDAIGNTIGRLVEDGISSAGTPDVQADQAPQVAANGTDPLDAAIQTYRQMYDAGDFIDGSPAMQINSDGTVTPLLNADGSQAIINEACFVAGTLIHTRNGLKPIEQISAGDWVAARHELNADGTVGWRKVLETYQHGSKTVLDLTVRHPTGEQETFTTTPNHRFFVNGREWRAAAELRPGDQFALRDGGTSQFVGTARAEGLRTVYNFAVEEDHTYFVGERGIWVHNVYYGPGAVYTGVDGQTHTMGPIGGAEGLHPVGGYSNVGQFPGFIPGNATYVVVLEDKNGNTYYKPMSATGPLALPMAAGGSGTTPGGGASAPQTPAAPTSNGAGSGQTPAAPADSGKPSSNDTYNAVQNTGTIAGIVGSGVELRAGAESVGYSIKALKAGRNPVGYWGGKGWTGGSAGRWTTLRITRIAEAGGEFLGGFGIGLEVGNQIFGDHKEPTWKFTTDLIVGVAGVTLGPEVGLAAGLFFLTDAFYKHGADYRGGGIQGLINHAGAVLGIDQMYIPDDRPVWHDDNEPPPVILDDVPSPHAG